MPMSKELSPEMETPPALPPKNYKQRKATSVAGSSSSSSSPNAKPIIVTTMTPPPSPKPIIVTTTTPPPTPPASPSPKPPATSSGENGSTGRPDSRMATVCEELSDGLAGEEALLDGNGEGYGYGNFYCHSHQLPNSAGEVDTAGQPINTPQLLDEQVVEEEATTTTEVAPASEASKQQQQQAEADTEVASTALATTTSTAAENEEMLINMLEEVNITRYLILKKKDEDGPEVKGGYIDALIVHASRVQKVADNGRHHPHRHKQKPKPKPRQSHSHFHTHLPLNASVVSVHSVRAAFSEAFITTFRTFIQPIDVIEKLTHRYTYFFCQVQDNKQKAAKETFSLLVRVVNDLT